MEKDLQPVLHLEPRAKDECTTDQGKIVLQHIARDLLAIETSVMIDMYVSRNY